MEGVTLHLLSPDWDEPGRPEAFLDTRERERAGRFVRAADARRWIVFRAKAKKVLGDHAGGELLEWREGPGGKPRVELPGLEFNLSHSDRLAALIVSLAGPVGVDLEPFDRAAGLIECEDSFCHPDELATLPADPLLRGERLLELWTAKEALLKAVGTGLQFPPTEMMIRDDRAEGGPAECESFHLLRPRIPAVPAHCLAVAVRDSVTEVHLA